MNTMTFYIVFMLMLVSILPHGISQEKPASPVGATALAEVLGNATSQIRLVSPSGDTTGKQDAANLQATVMVLQASGEHGSIVLNGRYVIDSSIKVTGKPGVSFLGIDASVTMAAPKTIALDVVDTSDVCINGIHFVGSGTEDPWSSNDWIGTAGVRVDNSRNCTIRNCKFTNHAGPSILFSRTCESLTISDNRIVGMGSPAITFGDNGSDFGIGGCAATSAIANSLIITNNHISGHAIGIFLTSGDTCVLANNVIKDIPAQHAIYVTVGGQMSITGNAIRNCAMVGLKVQWQSPSTCEHVVSIVGNTIEKVGEIGISVNTAAAGIGQEMQNVNISGNHVYDAGQYGIYLKGPTGCHVSGNRVKKTGYIGIILSSFSGHLSGNSVEASEADAVHLQDPLGTVSISDMEIIDSPVNAAANPTVVYRTCLYLADADKATNVYLDGIRLRYERVSEPVGVGALQYAVRAEKLLRVTTGVLMNDTSKTVSIMGTHVNVLTK